MYIWIQLLTATPLLSINYDENIILSWMNLELKAECKGKFQLNEQGQVVSDMFSHYLAVLKKK